VTSLQLARRYQNTAMSDAVRDAHPNSVRALVMSNMEDLCPIWRQFVTGAARVANNASQLSFTDAGLYLLQCKSQRCNCAHSRPWRAAAAALRQNGTAFKLHYGGIEPWEYMKQNPNQEELLSKCMTNADVIGEASSLAFPVAWLGSVPRVTECRPRGKAQLYFEAEVQVMVVHVCFAVTCWHTPCEAVGVAADHATHKVVRAICAVGTSGRDTMLSRGPRLPHADPLSLLAGRYAGHPRRFRLVAVFEDPAKLWVGSGPAACGLSRPGLSDCFLSGYHRYRNTAMSDAMRDAHPNSVRAIVLSNMEDLYPIWRHFSNGVHPGSRC